MNDVLLNNEIVRRLLQMIKEKDQMFMMIDDSIISLLYQEHYFNGDPNDDSLESLELTKKGIEKLNSFQN